MLSNRFIYRTKRENYIVTYSTTSLYTTRCLYIHLPSSFSVSRHSSSCICTSQREVDMNTTRWRVLLYRSIRLVAFTSSRCKRRAGGGGQWFGLGQVF